LAEFCGRWGCSWWENIITIILVSLKGKSAVLLLGLLLIPIVFVVLILLVGLIPAFELIASFGRDKQDIKNQTILRNKTKAFYQQELSLSIVEEINMWVVN
jgi:hypothetical protein